MKKIRKHYIFKGWVQGVGFRYSAQYIARSLGLTGWVKNEWDGSVVMEAQGDEASLDLLVEKLINRRYVRIEQLIQSTIPLEEEREFQVKY